MHLLNKNEVKFVRLTAIDEDILLEYLSDLSPETKHRFGPHGFDRDSVRAVLGNEKLYMACAAKDTATGRLLAYAIIKHGFLEHDRPRLETYGLVLNAGQDCTFAPSVADQWQGRGMGRQMLIFVMNELSNAGYSRIILWGGVQAGNERAVRFYFRNGFKKVGEFEYYGMNYDMIFEITDGINKKELP